MKIAIVVHGRFHAFDLARSLLEQGHSVTLFTNYPVFAVQRFGIPRSAVRAFLLHGIISRIVHRFPFVANSQRFEAWLHSWFARWAACVLQRESWDVIYSWSGVSAEILKAIGPEKTLRLVVRGSTHIRTQWELLSAEEQRTGVSQEKPSQWRINREEREYALADGVIVLSSFCRQTFLDHGFPQDRIGLMISGTRVNLFRPKTDVIEERCRRILSGAPLRVLNVGTFSYRKGVFDFAKMVSALHNARFEFRFVGSVHPEAASLARTLNSKVEFVPRRPQPELPTEYAWADLFVFPTIEEGLPAVLAQASASGIPMLTTPNGAGHDIVSEDKTGWVLPIRDSQAFIDRLHWCDSHRSELAQIVRSTYSGFHLRDWRAVADDFIAICNKLIKRKHVADAPRSKSPSLAKLKTALVVQGRFYIFDLARELIRQGVEVVVFTNYPKRIVERFGVPQRCVRNALAHGIMSRCLQFLDPRRFSEALLHRWFSRWAARSLQNQDFTVVQCLSGVGEDVFDELTGRPVLKVLVRGSAHIETQRALLESEQQKAGRILDKPTDWMIGREKREYDSADLVFVLSTFAHDSFLERGYPKDKLQVLQLGSNQSLLRPSKGAVEERCRRVRATGRLRVLSVGTFSYRKGARDLIEIARQCSDDFEFVFVGNVAREARALRSEAALLIRFVPRQTLEKLSEYYSWADLFIFPTIEDGFAAVLAEAQAAGLPILATTNCAASDIVDEGKTGWVLPPWKPNAFAERLRWCHDHRGELAEMVEKVMQVAPRDWSHVARDFIHHCREALLSQRPPE